MCCLSLLNCPLFLQRTASLNIADISSKYIALLFNTKGPFLLFRGVVKTRCLMLQFHLLHYVDKAYFHRSIIIEECLVFYAMLTVFSSVHIITTLCLLASILTVTALDAILYCYNKYVSCYLCAKCRATDVIIYVFVIPVNILSGYYLMLVLCDFLAVRSCLSWSASVLSISLIYVAWSLVYRKTLSPGGP